MSVLKLLTVLACGLLPLFAFRAIPFDPSAPPPTTAGCINYNPGHYLRNNTDKYNTNVILAPENAKFKGLIVHIPWGRLEPTAGSYDFSIIDNLLGELRTKNKRLFVNIAYKSHQKAAVRMLCAPRDLIALKPGATDPGLSPFGENIDLERTDAFFIQKHTGYRACQSAMWRPHVANRFRALIRKLGERYKNEPLLEGIVFEETATSMGAKTTPASYGDAVRAAAEFNAKDFFNELKGVWAETRAAFPTKVIMPHINYIASGGPPALDLFNYLKSINAGVTGPDPFAAHHDYPGKFSEGAELYDDFAGKIPLGMEGQYTFMYKKVNASKCSAGLTPEHVADWVVNRLKVNYMFWNDGGLACHEMSDVRAALEKTSYKITSARPANMPCN